VAEPLSSMALGVADGVGVEPGFFLAGSVRAVSRARREKMFRRRQIIGRGSEEKENEGEVPSPLQASGLGSIIRTLIRNF
jgi:hypothetical protein